MKGVIWSTIDMKGEILIEGKITLYQASNSWEEASGQNQMSLRR